MYIFSNCHDFIRTIPALTYDSMAVEDINTQGEDHIYDETRYMCMFRPITEPRKKQKERESFFDPLDLFERPRVTNPYAY